MTSAREPYSGPPTIYDPVAETPLGYVRESADAHPPRN